MKKAAFVFVLFILAAAVFSQEFLPQGATDETLTRTVRDCLQNLKKGDFDTAEQIANFGIKIDDSCADFYFVKAKAAKNAKRADIISFLESAFDGRKWILADKTAARIFFAQNLAAVKRFDDALSVLDFEPCGFSADAEFCRAECLFALGKNDEALAQIQSSISAFWRDARFPILFFKNADAKNLSEQEQTLAGQILQNISFFEKENSDIFLFAAPFCEDESQKLNFLAEYKKSAKNVSAQYWLLALQLGAASEDEAFDFFAKSEKIEFAALENFALLIESEELREKTERFLADFSGEMTFENGGICASYKNGEVFFAESDANFDGVPEWSANFCENSATKIDFQDFQVAYNDFPFVKSVKTDSFVCEIAANSLEWSPFFIEKAVFSQFQSEFPILVPSSEANSLSNDEIFAKSSKIATRKQEKRTDFFLRNGIFESAQYFEKDALFAFAEFENGALARRYVDKDGDCSFETEEFYGFSPESVLSDEDRAFMTEVFGGLEIPEGLRLEKIRINLAQTGEENFVEEYFPQGGISYSWEFQKDGAWKSRQIVEGELERREFVHPITETIVTIGFKNGMPQTFSDERGTHQIVRDEKYPIYWLGEPSSEENAKKIMEECKMQNSNMTVVLGGGGEKFLAFRSENDFFAEVIQQ